MALSSADIVDTPVTGLRNQLIRGRGKIEWQIATGIVAALAVCSAAAGITWGTSVPVPAQVIGGGLLVTLGAWAGWLDACPCRPIGWGAGLGVPFLFVVGGTDLYPAVPWQVEAIAVGVAGFGLVGMLGYGLGVAARTVQD